MSAALLHPTATKTHALPCLQSLQFGHKSGDKRSHACTIIDCIFVCIQLCGSFQISHHTLHCTQRAGQCVCLFAVRSRSCGGGRSGEEREVRASRAEYCVDDGSQSADGGGSVAAFQLSVGDEGITKLALYSSA